jgi:ribonuclease HI
VLFHYLVSSLDRLPCIVLGFQMLESLLPHIGFVDGTSCSAHNLSSTAWGIYAPTNELISLRGVCLSRATNNIAEYSAVIELLTNAISLGIHRLVIRLDSHLVML